MPASRAAAWRAPPAADPRQLAGRGSGRATSSDEQADPAALHAERLPGATEVGMACASAPTPSVCTETLLLAHSVAPDSIGACRTRHSPNRVLCCGSSGAGRAARAGRASPDAAVAAASRLLCGGASYGMRWPSSSGCSGSTDATLTGRVWQREVELLGNAWAWKPWRLRCHAAVHAARHAIGPR